MCVITATAIASAIGISVGASAAGAAGIGAAGVIAGVANVALAVGAVAAVAGTALGAVGSYQQGKAQEAQYRYQSEVQRQNQEIANNNAAMERQAGLEEARKQRIKTLQAIGSQKTALAANGVDVGYGTSLDIVEDTSMLGELDALMIESDSERKAQNYELQANNFANEANLSNFASRNARTAANTNGLAGGIKTVGVLADSISSPFLADSISSPFLGGGLGSLGKGKL